MRLYYYFVYFDKLRQIFNVTRHSIIISNIQEHFPQPMQHHNKSIKKQSRSNEKRRKDKDIDLDEDNPPQNLSLSTFSFGQQNQTANLEKTQCSIAQTVIPNPVQSPFISKQDNQVIGSNTFQYNADIPDMNVSGQRQQHFMSHNKNKLMEEGEFMNCANPSKKRRRNENECSVNKPIQEQTKKVVTNTPTDPSKLRQPACQRYDDVMHNFKPSFGQGHQATESQIHNGKIIQPLQKIQVTKPKIKHQPLSRQPPRKSPVRITDPPQNVHQVPSLNKIGPISASNQANTFQNVPILLLPHNNSKYGFQGDPKAVYNSFLKGASQNMMGSNLQQAQNNNSFQEQTPPITNIHPNPNLNQKQQSFIQADLPKQTLPNNNPFYNQPELPRQTLPNSHPSFFNFSSPPQPQFSYFPMNMFANPYQCHQNSAFPPTLTPEKNVDLRQILNNLNPIYQRYKQDINSCRYDQEDLRKISEAREYHSIFAQYRHSHAQLQKDMDIACSKQKELLQREVGVYQKGLDKLQAISEQLSNIQQIQSLVREMTATTQQLNIQLQLTKTLFNNYYSNSTSQFIYPDRGTIDIATSLYRSMCQAVTKIQMIVKCKGLKQSEEADTYEMLMSTIERVQMNAGKIAQIELKMRKIRDNYPEWKKDLSCSQLTRQNCKWLQFDQLKQTEQLLRSKLQRLLPNRPKRMDIEF